MVQVDLIGSDGKVYRFLAKPKDTWRNDNRMMKAASVLYCHLANQLEESTV